MSTWIKWNKGLVDKPEVIGMAETLKLSRKEVAACCMLIWEWVDDNSLDGCNAPRVTKTFLDERVHVTGFACAMEKEGWLRVQKDGLFFVNGDRHNGQTAKRRSLTSNRVTKTRNAPSVTKALPEKRREEKNNKPPTPFSKSKPDTWAVACSCMTSDVLRSDVFESSWREWCRDRADRGKKVTANAAKRQIRELEAMGLAGAVASIDQSIRNGWAGLFPPKTTVVPGSKFQDAALWKSQEGVPG